MVCVVQRVSEAEVVVDDARVARIDAGLLVLAGVEADDTDEQCRKMAEKLGRLRVFRSADGTKHFDLDVTAAGGAVLMVSNFTVAASTQKGRRPSLDSAAPPDVARGLFDNLVAQLRGLDVSVQTGQFGADMRVRLCNDGPVTFIVRA